MLPPTITQILHVTSSHKRVKKLLHILPKILDGSGMRRKPGLSRSGCVSCWIGLHDENATGVLQWEDGSTPSYVAWAHRYPKHSTSKGSQCVFGRATRYGWRRRKHSFWYRWFSLWYAFAYSPFEWRDTSCTNRKVGGYVCSMHPLPVVTLVGTASVTVEATSDPTATYDDPGCTAWDVVDGDLSESLIYGSTVRLGTPGTYLVTCEATNSGGVSASAVRVVNVVDSDDGCSEAPCDQGSCVDRVDGYTCTCHAGWYGPLCDRPCPTSSDVDGDGVLDCVDGCPTDASKTGPGLCGCGVSDADSDGDGTEDCHDGCPNDAGKTTGGVCGCGTADSDSDSDGTPNCVDGCPNDPAKTTPGSCGCGVADTDSDGDGSADCVDSCPSDPRKVSRGVCGCGVSDVDTDRDGLPDCVDGCPSDASKGTPGVCGCGVADTDTDGDGAANCVDDCPSDPAKTEPGTCGCGVADDDTDGDGILDCNDVCPSVGDTDGDGTQDCNDGCPADRFKISPGVCGCGVSEVDTDGDGVRDCNDLCPADASKTAPGVCGCSVSDRDTDGDGTSDCEDGCPSDAGKTAAGICGCGVADTDSDGDNTADCYDACPADPAKATSTGHCGQTTSPRPDSL